MWLRQSTAAEISVGPFISSTDFKTLATGLTLSQADIRLKKAGGNFAQTNNSAGATHEENGFYEVPLDTTDTNTLGRLRVAIAETGALPVWRDFMVIPAEVYDSLIAGSDKLQIDMVQFDGSDIDFYNGTCQTGGNTPAPFVQLALDHVGNPTRREIELTWDDGYTQMNLCIGWDDEDKIALVQDAWDRDPENDTDYTVGGYVRKPVEVASEVAAEVDAVLTTAHGDGDWDQTGISGTDVQDALTAQGYTTDRAALLDNMDAAITSRATPAQVNTEVVDALINDTYGEVAGVPSITSSLKDKLNWIFALSRNELRQTSSGQALRNDANDANLATASGSDNGTTTTRGEWE